MFIVPDPIHGELQWDAVVEIESLEAHAAAFNRVKPNNDELETRDEYRVVPPHAIMHYNAEGELMEVLHVCDPAKRRLL